MSEVIRYRLIGSVFLLAMAATFLPMLFDTPAPAAKEIGATISSGAASAATTPDGIDPSDGVDELITQLRRDQEAMDQAFADSDMQSQIEAMRGKVDEDGYWADNGTRFGEPILTPARDDTAVFAVQLATFDKEDNARKLREQLRQDGQEAFISQYKQSGIGGEKIRYRVAVGPMLSHTLAKEQRTSYTQKYGVKAIVVAMAQ